MGSPRRRWYYPTFYKQPTKHYLGMKNYGLPYMGSKSAIAEKIVEFLPKSTTLVDLFGGGGAITDCASQSGKW